MSLDTKRTFQDVQKLGLTYCTNRQVRIQQPRGLHESLNDHDCRDRLVFQELERLVVSEPQVFFQRKYLDGMQFSFKQVNLSNGINHGKTFFWEYTCSGHYFPV